MKLIAIFFLALVAHGAPLEQNLKWLKARDPSRREAALKAIVAEGPKDSKSVNAIAELLNCKSVSKKHQTQVRETGMDLLLRLKSTDPQILNKVAGALRDSSASVRAKATLLLLEAKTQDPVTLRNICEALLFESNNPSYQDAVRENAADLVAKLAPKEISIMVILAKALSSIDDRVREVATHLLIAAKPADPAVIGHIHEAMKYTAYNPAFQQSVRENAASVLRQIGAK